MTEFDQLFKALSITENPLKETIIRVATIERICNNSYILEEGKYIKWLTIVVKGKIRVWQENENRQILLYYVTPVQTCVLSLTASFKDCKSIINAKATENTTIIKIPVRFISKWSLKYPSWNRFVINALMFSYEDLLHAYEKLAFYKIDKRLLDYLQTSSKKNKSTILNFSHNELAKELGTTREVVSKILKQFQISGLVNLKFKHIELL